MPWPHPAVPSPTLALAGWCPLSPTGAQTTQLLVEPPWRPAVLWDRVTLTCQGSGTCRCHQLVQGWAAHVAPVPRTPGHPSAPRCPQCHGHPPWTCLKPLSERGPSCPTDNLVLQVPARALLEGDTVTLRCRGRWNDTVTRVQFYQDEKDLGGSINGIELSLFPLQLNHSGSYSCGGLVRSFMSRSAAVTVTVHELFSVPVLEGPPDTTQGSPLTLSCLSTPSPLRPRAPLLHVFYRDGQTIMGVSHLGNYGCEVHSKGGLWGWARGVPTALSGPLVGLLHIPQTPFPGHSITPLPCLCPHSARGQCHHHPRSPGTPGACR
uniref:Uncharacterized protein n=1 Tax=Geospiza parvula TaxID=87175 RepID=A0A8U8BJX5_GEOPR